MEVSDGLSLHKKCRATFITWRYMAAIQGAELLEAMWNEVDATTIIPTMMHVEGDVLYIGTRRGISQSMAKFICLVQEKLQCHGNGSGADLGRQTKKRCNLSEIEEETDVYPQQVEVYVGGHPLPNEQGLKAARKILDMIDEAN